MYEAKGGKKQNNRPCRLEMVLLVQGQEQVGSRSYIPEKKEQQQDVLLLFLEHIQFGLVYTDAIWVTFILKYATTSFASFHAEIRK